MWRIVTEALKWYTGEVRDGGVGACRTCPARLAVFAAVEAARAAHLTRVAPAVTC